MPPPLPSRGPGATAAGIFSSDMCHLSCHRGGGGGRRLLTLSALPALPPPPPLSARRGPAEPGAAVGHQRPAPTAPTRYRCSRGGALGGGRGPDRLCGCLSAGWVIFSWEWMAIAAAPVPGAAVLRKGTRQGSDGSGDGDGDGAPCPVQGGGWGPLNGLGSWHAPGRQRVPNKDQTQAPAAQLGLHPEQRERSAGVGGPGPPRCHPGCLVKARPLRASVSPCAGQDGGSRSGRGVTMPCRSPPPGSAVPSGPVLPGPRSPVGGTARGQRRSLRARGARGSRPGRQVTFPSPLLAAPALYCTRRCGCRGAQQGRASPDALGA